MLFEITLDLARFAGVSIFELRDTEASEVLYLYRCLTTFKLDDAPAADAEGGRVKRFADEVDWFD